jgi:phosphatidate cytidylyltransferase
LNEKNRNLAVRAASALLLLPIALFLLWAGVGTTAALVAFAALVVTAELYHVTGLSLRHPAAVFGILAAASLPLLALLDDPWPWAMGVLAFSPIVALGALTLAPPDGDLRRGADRAGFVALGPAHVGLSLACIVLLRAEPGGHGFGWIFVLLAVTWGNDTGAYFAGRFLGRHKLYEQVSPKKTWEGFWGGMVAATLLAVIVSFTPLVPEFRGIDAVLLGVVAGVLGPLGDLAESMLKRAFGVKDSGKIMPGHGGLYDRLDALLFNAPWVLVFVRVLRELI